MKSKKWVGLCAASAFALFAAGCGGGGGGGTTSGLSGTVADGLAMANAKVTAQSATGSTIEVGTTDANGQYAGFAFPEKFVFPAMMSVTRANGKEVLRSIIPSQPETTATTHINPITQTITTQIMPTGSSLASLDVSDGDNGFAKQAKTVVQTAFGSTIDYDTFAGKSFKARTASDPKAGGLADTLIDTLAGLDPTRKPEDLLASATDTKDPSVSKNLMASSAFQARFAGELISQGRPAGEVKTLIQAEAVSGADTSAILANTETYAKAFEEVFTSANSALTGSDSQKRASLEAIVESAAVTVARIVEKKGVTGGDALTNMLSNSMTLVKEPLIAIGKTDQGGENLALILAATREQMSDLINTSTVDLTQSGANVATLGTQVKNFGEIVSSAVSHSLKSGKDKSKLDDKEKWLVATNMGKGIASSLTSYMSDMAVDSSAMTDAQKANMAKAGNAAKNTATALDSALVAMAADQDADAMEDDMLDSMAGALVAQSAQTFKNYDMTVDASTFSGAAAKSLTNMAKLVVDNTAILHGQATALNSNKQAALVEAMAGQLLNELKNMDLTGDELPESATNVANNLARAVGPALVEKVGQSSDYQGSNFQILATQAVANAVTELKKTATLTGTIDSETLTRLQQGASSAAETSRTTMEATFKTIEEQGISLAEITGGLAEAGLDGSAMDVVMHQVQSTLASGGTVMKDAARDIAETAASMANAVLENGGSLTQVRDTIAAPMAAMAQVAKGQEGQSSEQILASIRGSANTMEQTAQAMASSRDMSLENFILTTGNIAAVVGTRLTGDATDALLSSVRGNIATGEGMTLETLAGQPSQHNENILTQAIAQQAVIQEQATVIVPAVNRLPEFIPFAENLRVNMGKTYTGLLPIKDEEGETNLTFRIITSGEKGTATITNPQTGAFTYQPRPGFVGPDTFTFVINDGIGETTPASVTMHVVNTLPEFLPPTETIIAQAGQPIQGILPIKNDQTGETLTFRIVTQGNKGAITLDNPATGAFTYRPNPGTFGPDTFTFAVSDGAGETAPIPMTIHVANKLPEFLPPTETIIAQVGQTIQGILPIKNDQTGETLVFKIVSQGSKGKIILTNPATGAFTYQPNPGTSGPDTFTFAVSDGAGETAPIPMTVHVVNNPPSPVVDTPTITAGKTWNGTLAVSNADGDTLTYRIVTNGTKGVVTLTNAATGTYTYVPNPGAYGTDTFTFIVNDGIADSKAVTVTMDLGPSLSIGDITVTEGDTGSVAANIPVTLDKASGQAVSVNYATSVAGNTTANVDYTTSTGTLTIAAGQTSGVISVPVLGDTLDEANEVFRVTLNNPVNVSIADAQGDITIIDNDPVPTVAFTAATQSVNEGALVIATLQLSAASGLDISIPFTASGTATAGTDYSNLTASPITISAGNTSVNVTFSTSSDTVADNGETVVLTLGIPTYATLGTTTTHMAVLATPIVPRTGQTTTYVAGDDGALKKGVAWPDPRFSLATPDNGTVTDNLTGLIWLKNANCFGSQTWTDALNSANTLISGSCGLTDNSEAGAWRLPNLRELRSLSDYGYSHLVLRSDTLFTDMRPNFYWSSTTNANDISSAFYGFIIGGSGNYRSKSNAHHVLPVRGESVTTLAPVPKSGQTISYGTRDDGALQKGIPWPTTRFFDRGDGTIYDALTDLIWMKNADCFGSMDWYRASTQASDFNNGRTSCLGYGGSDTDWRLPSINELESLIDFGHSNPSLLSNHPFTGVQNDYYWSSTTGAAYPTVATWHVDISYGSIVTYSKSGYGYVWLVRGGQ